MTINRSSIRVEEETCGWRVTPSCSDSGFFQRFATRGWFIFGTALLPLSLTTFDLYLQVVGRSITKDVGWNVKIFDYFYLAVIALQSVFALLACSGGSKSSHPVWIGASSFPLGIVCLLAIIPFRNFYIDSPVVESMNITSDLTLCIPHNVASSRDMASSVWFKMITLFALVIISAFVHITNLIHTLAYMIENKGKTKVTINIAIFVGIRLQSEMLLAQLSEKATNFWISLLVFGFIFIIFSTLVSLFPQTLADGKEENKIIQLQDMNHFNRRERYAEEIIDTGFCACLKRVTSNKAIVLEAIALGLIYTVVKNLTDLKNELAKSQLHINPTTDTSDPYTSITLEKSLRTPFLLITTIFFAFLFKNKKSDKLSNFTIGLGLKLTFMIVVISLLRCDVQPLTGIADGSNLSCSRDCRCSKPEPVFEPVCLEGGLRTYLSPCHAGCRTYDTINNYVVYRDCSCGFESSVSHSPGHNTFTKGSCANCFSFWIHFQSLFLILLIATIPPIVVHLTLILKIIKKQDNLVSFGFLLSVVTCVHLGGKLLFNLISQHTCDYISPDNYTCVAHSKLFTILVPVLAICLALISGVLSFITKRCIPVEKEENEVVAEEEIPFRND